MTAGKTAFYMENERLDAAFKYALCIKVTRKKVIEVFDRIQFIQNKIESMLNDKADLHNKLNDIEVKSDIQKVIIDFIKSEGDVAKRGHIFNYAKSIYHDFKQSNLNGLLQDLLNQEKIFIVGKARLSTTKLVKKEKAIEKIEVVLIEKNQLKKLTPEQSKMSFEEYLEQQQLDREERIKQLNKKLY